MKKREFHWELDCRDLPPPYPLLGAKRAVGLMQEGEDLCLLAAYPEAPLDFPVWCRMTGNRLVRDAERDGVYAVVIRKARA